MSDATIAQPATKPIPYGLLLGVPLAAVVLLGAWSYRTTSQLEHALAVRPPIAVVPLEQLLTAHGQDQSNVEQQAVRVRALAQRLKDNGYIVIDGRSLYAYPRAVEVRP